MRLLIDGQVVEVPLEEAVNVIRPFMAKIGELEAQDATTSPEYKKSAEELARMMAPAAEEDLYALDEAYCRASQS